MDYKKLLVKYAAFIKEEEGLDYISRIELVTDSFTAEDIEELLLLSKTTLTPAH